MPHYGKFVAIYDITDNRERLRCSKLLEGYGLRVQRSAFEGRLTRSGLASLHLRIEALKLQSGFVLIYRIDALAKRMSGGKVPPSAADEHLHAIIVAPRAEQEPARPTRPRPQPLSPPRPLPPLRAPRLL